MLTSWILDLYVLICSCPTVLNFRYKPKIRIHLIGTAYGETIRLTLGSAVALGIANSTSLKSKQLAVSSSRPAVTEDTFKLTQGMFRFEALGEKVVKGKERPIKVYRVIAPSTRRTRFDIKADT